jgi:hypothetical protein
LARLLNPRLISGNPPGCHRRALRPKFKLDKIFGSASICAMKIPEFKPSKSFLGDIRLACLVAKLKNSDLPKVAARHIATTKKDPPCKIYLRCSKANEISAWQREMLERLFVKEKLPSFLEEGMKEYETGKDWEGYDQNDTETYQDIRRYGIVPFLTLHEIVIDDVTKEVIISANTDWDGHLDEHGITIYLSEGKWRFDLGDRQYDYYSGIESEVTKARMAKVFPDILSNRSESDDTKFIFGTWNYDEKAAVEIYKKFKWTKSKIDDEIKCYEGMRLIISPDQMQRIIRNDHGSSYFEARFVRCERRGNVIKIFYERKYAKGMRLDVGSYDCYYTGDVMVDINFNGEILKRVSAIPRFEDKDQL